MVVGVIRRALLRNDGDGDQGERKSVRGYEVVVGD